jgi:glycosyltransferase involved in cell wall biosynthesis
MISLEHTLPQTRWSQLDLEHLTTMQGDLNLFISDYSRGQWLFDESNSQIIHHGVDTETFSPADVPQEPIILSVVNDWVNRDWCCGFRYWQQATAGLPVKPVGNTPGLSEAASSMDELVHFYRTSQVFVNTSLISPIPTALLEAMSCGAAVVTTNNCMIPEIVKHGYNGYLANSPQEMKTYLVDLLNDADKRKTFGINARRTITENFSLESFVDTWNKYLRTTSEIVFV